MANKIPDEIYDIITDPKKLKSYKDMSVLGGLDTNQLYLELPYDDIKAYVENTRDDILKLIPDVKQSTFQWEHVGSTLIKGMPGTKHPDAMMLFKSFPPPKECIASLLQNEFYFMGSGPFSCDDLWFF